MTVIDDRGRLFGRLNFIDAIVVLLALAMVGFAAVGYSLFRLPHDPVIDAFRPATVTEMQEQRVKIEGRNFLPYLRAFIKRSDGKDFVKRPQEHESIDAFTIVNNTRITFLLESPTFAELQIPALPAGTYDLRMYNDTKLVFERPRAVVVTPVVPKEGPQWVPTGSVIAYGVFTNLRPDTDTAAIRSGAHVVSGGVTWGDLLAVEAPRPDVAPLAVANRPVGAAVLNRVQIPAKLRVRCVIDDVVCRIDGAQVAPKTVLAGTVGAQPVTFRITDVESDREPSDIGPRTFQSPQRPNR
jgi:hypothetical protein